MRKENGITLISLIITIIVMLILAGVSISTVVGEGGILKRAADSKVAMEEAAEKEKEDLEKISVKIDEIIGNNSNIEKPSEPESGETLEPENGETSEPGDGETSEPEDGDITPPDEDKEAVIISFTVGGDNAEWKLKEIYTYYAEEGMTFREWINSEYNTDGFEILPNDGRIGFQEGVMLLCDLEMNYIDPDSVIEPNGEYGGEIK